MDDLAARIHQLTVSTTSQNVLLYKEDMDRAFRQLYAHPKSVPLLGYRWRNKYYFDLVMVMGCRIAPYVCQRTTNMITFIHASMAYFLLNYVDDFIGAELEQKVHRAHAALINVLRDIGITRSRKKSVKPTQIIEFVGNLFDTTNMTIGITQERKVEILSELNRWRFRKSCTRNQLESLIRKLQFLSNCVRPGRLFVSCLLTQLKGMSRGKYYPLAEETRKDVKWWYLFLPGYSGTSIMWMVDCVKIDGEMAMDSCLKGTGGWCGNEVFSERFPKREYKHITHLELWAVILSVKLWGKKLAGKIISIHTDNEAVACILNTGRSQDLLLQKQLRELTWWLAIHQVKIRAQHILGVSNRIPDMLSRMHEGAQVKREFDRTTKGMGLQFVKIPGAYFNLTHNW